jgi:hypothetical protein
MAGVVCSVGAMLAVGLVSIASPAHAAQAPIGLGTSSQFSVLAGSAVTNTGPSTLDADVGVDPSAAVTGFPPGLIGGATHIADGVALQAKSDLVTAYNDAAGRSATGGNIGPMSVGQTLTPGVYNASTSLDRGGPLTLNGQGNPNAVFIFQVGSTLVTTRPAA